MYELKNFAIEELKRRSDKFILVMPDYDTPSVCFYYLPLSLRGLDRSSKEFKERVNKVSAVEHRCCWCTISKKKIFFLNRLSDSCDRGVLGSWRSYELFESAMCSPALCS